MGASARTVQRHGMKYGWPTDEQRARGLLVRVKRGDWTASAEAASAMLAFLGEDDDTEATPEKPES
ncbi:hypothetical protein [Arthrobacter sp. TWP1-1]|uniref:hypothetical protein n=1 Tax=Arthrobacter sp. TWP1-1 TaxID=2804568 RepID=UPI003CE8A0FD